MPRTCCQDEVATDALCPCGKNTVKCPGEDVCLPKDVADVICPCKARLQLELLCEPNNAPILVVPSRARSHKRLAASWITQPQARSPDFSTACVAPGNPCPCGKNSLSCSDPNDVPRLRFNLELCRQLQRNTIEALPLNWLRRGQSADLHIEVQWKAHDQLPTSMYS